MIIISEKKKTNKKKEDDDEKLAPRKSSLSNSPIRNWRDFVPERKQLPVASKTHPHFVLRWFLFLIFSRLERETWSPVFFFFQFSTRKTIFAQTFSCKNDVIASHVVSQPASPLKKERRKKLALFFQEKMTKTNKKSPDNCGRDERRLTVDLDMMSFFFEFFPNYFVSCFVNRWTRQPISCERQREREKPSWSKFTKKFVAVGLIKDRQICIPVEDTPFFLFSFFFCLTPIFIYIYIYIYIIRNI